MSRRIIFAAVAASFALAGTAHADLTLNTAGINLGLTLSTFADQFPYYSSGNPVGPIGVGFNSDGTVLVASYGANAIVQFSSDTNGQHDLNNSPLPTTAINTAAIGASNPVGMISYGGSVYTTLQYSGELVKLNTNGSVNSIVASALGTATGIAVDASGNAYVSNVSNAIYKIDLSTSTVSTFTTGSAAGLAYDGITLSPDGSILYVEAYGSIDALYTSGPHAGDFVPGLHISTDGTADGAAAASGTLAGDVFINTNSGKLYVYNTNTPSTDTVHYNIATLIADGGSRGDLVTIDPSNGSLLISQSNSIVRLTLPAGSTFTTPTSAPEPASMAILGVGLLGLARMRRRRG